MKYPKGIGHKDPSINSRPLTRGAKARSSRVVTSSQVERPADAFVMLLKAVGLPAPETEVVFAPPRKFRADYCWPVERLIVEREGGLFMRGRGASAHARPLGILRDMERLNLAQSLGWRYLRFTPRQLESGEAIPLIRGLLTDRREDPQVPG